MRKLILIGTTGLALAFGAASAYAIPATSSPYVLDQQAQTSNAIGALIEGRSAFVAGDADQTTPLANPHGNGASEIYRGR